MGDETDAEPVLILVTMEADRRVNSIEGQPPEAALRSPRTSLFSIFCPATDARTARFYSFTTRRAEVDDSFEVVFDGGTLRILDKESGAVLMAFAPGMWATFESADIEEGTYAIRAGASIGANGSPLRRRRVIDVRELELRVTEGSLPWDESTRYDTVDIAIDGKSVADWVRPHVPPDSQLPRFLGHHVGTNMRKLLLGEGPKDQLGSTALLGCTCTVIECGPLLTRIEIEEETVTWSDFGPGFGADYEGLELRFHRNAYMAALTKLEQCMRTRA